MFAQRCLPPHAHRNACPGGPLKQPHGRRFATLPTRSPAPRSHVLDADWIMTRLNPAVTFVLRSRLHYPLSLGLMLLTVTGRRSGQRYTIPVGYQRRGECLLVLVSK